MTHTKQFQDQLQIAENYKNCLNQDDCGGGYWNEGVMAMKYKMDEYKKASAADAMNMAAPTYTPFINVAEKGVNEGICLFIVAATDALPFIMF